MTDHEIIALLRSNGLELLQIPNGEWLLLGPANEVWSWGHNWRVVVTEGWEQWTTQRWVEQQREQS